MKDYQTLKSSWIWDKFIEFMGTPCSKEINELEENTDKVRRVINEATGNGPKISSTIHS